MSSWMSFLSPHPNPHLFSQKKVYKSHTAPSSFRSILSMTTPTPKSKGKLRKTSPPPKLRPLSFGSADPIIDLTHYTPDPGAYDHNENDVLMGKIGTGALPSSHKLAPPHLLITSSSLSDTGSSSTTVRADDSSSSSLQPRKLTKKRTMPDVDTVPQHTPQEARGSDYQPTRPSEDDSARLLEVQSDCGHGVAGVSATKQRTSLFRNFSLSSRKSSTTNTSTTSSSSISGHGHARRQARPPLPPPPPPSSWADYASPLPSSSGSSAPGHGGSSSGWASSSGSALDLSATLKRWRKWRKSARSGGSAYSSRTSLEEGSLLVDTPSSPSQLPMKMPTQTLESQSSPSPPLRPSHDSQPRSSKDHKRGPSWGDAAITLFRSGNSSDGHISPTPVLVDGRPGVALINGRRVLMKKERVVDLNASESLDDALLKRPRAKFTLGDGGASQSSDIDLPCAPPVPQHARPPLLRRDAKISQDVDTGRRRWTLANAMIDEGISDAGLVRELERMREVAEWARRRERMARGSGQDTHHADSHPGDDDWDGWDEWDVGKEILEGRDVLEMERQKDKEEEAGKRVLRDSALHESPASEDGGGNGSSFPLNNTATRPMTFSSTSSLNVPSPSWLATQRALLTCRELILTERHYLHLLSSLVLQETATPPPPLMKHYAAELVRASEGVLKGMEKEPSPRGVARAFLELEELVEGAYVRWCGVVGGWFVEGSSTTISGMDGSVDASPTQSVRRKRSRVNYRTGAESAGDAVVEADADGFLTSPPVSPLKRTVSTWRKSMPSMPSLGLDGGSIYGAGRRREREDDREDGEKDKLETKPLVPVKKHTVRDLAILPTQRVMRYVLLYRDLLSHTPPTSSSRALVERAVEAACRIADKCDRAQGNAAFIVSANGRSDKRSKSHRGVARPAMPTRAASPSAKVVPTTTSVSATSSSCSSTSGSSVPTMTSTSTSTSASMSLLPAHTITSSSAGSSPTSTAGRSAAGRATGGGSPARRTSMTSGSLMALGWSKNRGVSLGVAAASVKMETVHAAPS